MTNPFYRLAPFIQDFIYRENWEELRPVQIDSIAAILDTPNHVLITSGTASGKTEAAFLPILTDLYQQPSSTIGAMYVGPLKALINDQFHRLEGLLEESGIPVQSWHGDISQSKKQRFLKKGQGILQITPESLEAMLINRQTELSRLFGDLRYVVLDEVHAFIGSDRGRQVLCQLQRLAKYQTRPARRIGLSATLGEPELAAEWLAGGTDYEVTHINDTVGRREVMLGLEHFIRVNEDDLVDEGTAEEESTTEENTSETINTEIEEDRLPVVDQTDEMFEHMATLVNNNRKTLVFANSRKDTEEIIHNLRRLAGVEVADEDNYYVHHGSISAANAPIVVNTEPALVSLQIPVMPATATSMSLERSIDGNSWTNLGNVSSNYLDTNVVCGSSYQYRLVALRSNDGMSSTSSSTSALTDVCPIPTVIGIYRNGLWTFVESNNTAAPTNSFNFGDNTWQALVGDWDGDGIDGVGIYRNGEFVLRNLASADSPENRFNLGQAEAGWQAIVGDWNGDGIDSIGLYKDGLFTLSDDNNNIQYRFNFGQNQAGWQAIAGDWDGNGADGIGLYKEGFWSLANDVNNPDGTSQSISYGPNQAGWQAIVGDWNGDGQDSIGLFNNGNWRMRVNSIYDASETSLNFGQTGDLPLAIFEN